MANFFVHIHTGPTDPTKAALGFLVALTALKEGHAVDPRVVGKAVGLFTAGVVPQLD